MNQIWYRARILPCSAVLLLCSSCATVSGFPDDPKSVNYANGHQTNLAAAEVDALHRIHGAASERLNMPAVEYRNSFIYSELGAIDDAFSEFLRKLRTQRSTFNIVTSGALLTLNGLAATTGTASTKAALSAASAGILGQKGSVDQELFKAETLAALIARMKAARLVALVPIKAGLTQNEQDYPLEEALVQLHAYRDVGNLLSTLDEISTDAGVTASIAKAQIETVTRDAVFRDSRSQISVIEDRVSKLSDSASLQLIFLMQIHLAERSKLVQSDLSQANPSNSRFSDPTKARSFMIDWLEDESGNAAEIKQWSDNLTTVGG